MADDVTTCDFCGWPGAVQEGTSYRCEVCGQTWTAAERAAQDEDEDEDESTP